MADFMVYAPQASEKKAFLLDLKNEEKQITDEEKNFILNETSFLKFNLILKVEHFEKRWHNWKVLSGEFPSERRVLFWKMYIHFFSYFSEIDALLQYMVSGQNSMVSMCSSLADHLATQQK